MVDDVITAGTAIRESVEILAANQADFVGVAVCLDRQEKVTEASTESAIQQVQQAFNIPVVSIVRLKNLIAFLETKEDSAYLSAIQEYRARYGVDY